MKHFHGNNGIFSSEEYRLECSEKKQLQSFSGVGAQHQNSKAERAIQTIMYMARTFLASIDPIFDLPKLILSAVTIYCICDVTYLYVDTLQINITNLLFLISL